MTAPIAVQLYTVREALAQDFIGTIGKIADMGYAGVETAGNYGGSPEAGAALFRELGLQIAGSHIGLPIGDDKNKILDTIAALGGKTLVCPWLPPENFQTLEGIQAVCDRINEADAHARARGMRLGYHNHDFEFAPLPDGSRPYDHMRRLLAPTVFFEVDTYWVQTAGGDPAAVVRELGERAPLLHIKDGPAVRGEPMTAVGEGVINVPPIVEAGTAAEWLIVELDQCATDMIEAVEKSIQYLTSKGLGRGR
jgi:sugar phosphate isomerase/epimerase